MTKLEWKQQAKNLKEENEFLKGRIKIQKEINNIAVGENYTLNLKLAKLSKEINEFVDYVRSGEIK